jgi:hypothetical protein
MMTEEPSMIAAQVVVNTLMLFVVMIFITCLLIHILTMLFSDNKSNAQQKLVNEYDVYKGDRNKLLAFSNRICSSIDLYDLKILEASLCDIRTETIRLHKVFEELYNNRDSETNINRFDMTVEDLQEDIQEFNLIIDNMIIIGKHITVTKSMV